MLKIMGKKIFTPRTYMFRYNYNFMLKTLLHWIYDAWSLPSLNLGQGPFKSPSCGMWIGKKINILFFGMYIQKHILSIKL